jgi:hypothetical protein
MSLTTPGLVVPISGPYVGTWFGYPIGTLNDDGYNLVATIQGQEINLSDAYGMTLTEAIYRGQNWRIRMRGLEWNRSGLLTALQMFGTTGNTNNIVPPVQMTTISPALWSVGDRWTKFCQILVLQAILGNPPTVPQTLTALSAGVAPQMSAEMLMTSKLRELPVEFVLLPYESALPNSANVWFTVA